MPGLKFTDQEKRQMSRIMRAAHKRNRRSIRKGGIMRRKRRK